MAKFFSTLLLLACGVNLVAAPLNYDVSADYTVDDNITRAELDRDIVKDKILGLAANATMRLPLNDISYFSVAGSLVHNQYQEYSKLDNNRVGLQAGYHIRPSPGYTAMRYYLQLGYEQRMYDSDLRDGTATTIALGFSKRITDLLSMRAGYSKESIDAEHVAFDADNNQLFLDFEYRLSDRNNLYLTLSNVDGDIVATAVPTSKIIQYSSAIVRDDAFLDLAPERWAYKLSAKTNAIRLGNSFEIDHRQGVDASVFIYDASASGGNDYQGMIISLAYLLRF